jgi:signal transduction histidine kinase
MPVFSDGFLGRDGKYRIALTYPITNGSSGEYVGIVEALVPTIQFFQSYGNIYDIKAQYLAVLDRNSVQLIHPVKSFIGKSFFGSYTQEVTGHNKVLNNVIHTVMSGQPDFAVYDFRNGERLNTGYPISVDGKLLYFIFVITPTSTIYSQIDNVVLTERIEMFSLLAGVTAAIVVLILFLLKWSSNLENEVKSRTKELYQANEQLRTHDKMQREFINVAAHELRTPIQAMLGLADLLKTKINDKEQHQLAEVISRNAKRLKRLSQEALDVTRIEGGSLTLSTERIDLNDLIAHVVGDYRQQIQESGNNNARLIFDSNKGSVFVKADKERIAQVFSNLLRNAVTFTKDGKDQTILVRLEERTREENHYENKNQVKREVVVSVRDSGKGIDQNVIPRLFTKFATTSFQGTGLALFISRSIIEAHGGKIWAENNKDAEGATFYFSLPQ